METSVATVLDKSKLPELGKSSLTAQAILQDCAERERMRWESDLGRFAVKLANKGFKVVQEDFMKAWKDLEAIGVGVIVYGRKGNPPRFQWHYSLKDIGTAALHPEQIGDIKPLTDKKEKPVIKTRTRKRRKLGRPKGSKNRPKLVHSIPQPAVKRSMVQPAVVFTVTGLDGKAYGIAFEEAIRISDQVNQIRQLAAKATA